MATPQQSRRPQTITVIRVKTENVQRAATPVRNIAVPPCSDRDEPAFNQSWKKVSQLKADGKLSPVPPAPTSGLHKMREKQPA